MGTEFWTYTEAEKILSKSYRTVKMYASKGTLVKVYVNNKVVGVTKDSVNQLAASIGIDGDAFNRFSVSKHGKQIGKLEERLARIEFVLGMKDMELKLTPSSASSLYKAVSEMRAKKEWEFSEIKSWISVLASLSEEDLTITSESVITTKPWKPYLDMAHALISYLSQSKFAGNEMAEDLSERLKETTKKLNSVILMWTLLKEGEVLNPGPGMTVREALEEVGVGYNGRKAIIKAISEGGRG